MITVYQSKKFMYHKEGYTKVATVDTDSIAEAFRLTQNIDGSWSQGPELSYDGKTYANKDFSEKVTVLTAKWSDSDQLLVVTSCLTARSIGF
jgi:hypothetical protein